MWVDTWLVFLSPLQAKCLFNLTPHILIEGNIWLSVSTTEIRTWAVVKRIRCLVAAVIPKPDLCFNGTVTYRSKIGMTACAQHCEPSSGLETMLPGVQGIASCRSLHNDWKSMFSPLRKNIGNGFTFFLFTFTLTIIVMIRHDTFFRGAYCHQRKITDKNNVDESRRGTCDTSWLLDTLMQPSVANEGHQMTNMREAWSQEVTSQFKSPLKTTCLPSDKNVWTESSSAARSCFMQPYTGGLYTQPITNDRLCPHCTLTQVNSRRPEWDILRPAILQKVKSLWQYMATPPFLHPLSALLVTVKETCSV